MDAGAGALMILLIGAGLLQAEASVGMFLVDDQVAVDGAVRDVKAGSGEAGEFFGALGIDVNDAGGRQCFVFDARSDHLGNG